MGMDNTIDSIMKKKCKLIICAQDIGVNSYKKIKKFSIENEIKLVEFGTKDELGKVFGKKSVGLVSINEGNFAKRLQNLLF